MLLPTAFFAALDRGALSISSTTGQGDFSGTIVSDSTREKLLRMSRGLAVLLLIVCAIPLSSSNFVSCLYRYLCSRIYVHLPPERGGPDGPEEPAGPSEHEMRLRGNSVVSRNRGDCVASRVRGDSVVSRNRGDSTASRVRGNSVASRVINRTNSVPATLDVLPEQKEEEGEGESGPDDGEFKVNPWACMILLAITVGVMAATAEFVSVVF